MAGEINIFEGFREFESFREYSELEPAMSAEAGMVAESIDEHVLGRTAVVREIGRDVETDERPIQRFGRINELSFFLGGLDARTYEGATKSFITKQGIRFSPNDFFRYTRKARGRVVGTDMEHSSLILRPDSYASLLTLQWWTSRLWAKVIDSEGNPLIDVDFADEK